MDYLRTLGSAAVASLVQKSGLNLPFSLGSRVAIFEGICSLYDATKRDDGGLVSVFEYDFKDNSRQNVGSLAKNSLRKLRTTRHPEVLKFMDAIELDSNVIYIMTERVQPLRSTLSAWSSRSAQEKEDWLLWGLHKISIALTFLNDPCNSTHGRICIDSIFISPSGEWKLGGLELLSNAKDDAAVIYAMGSVVPDSSSWASPEVKKTGWSVLKGQDPSTADAYALGLLIHALFNPSHPLPATASPPHPPPTPSTKGAIPNSIFTAFKRLLNPNPKSRLSAKGFLEIGMAETGFFATNRLVKVCAGLDNFSLGSEAEKNALLRTLKETASSFPLEFANQRILPSLISALEFGGVSAAAILPLVLQFGNNAPPDSYNSFILAPLIKLFASSDRGTRMALLEHLPEYVDKLDKKAVSDKIFPHLQTGFSDTVPIIREATVKSIILLSPKLNDRLLNNDLLRLLAKTQMDSEPSIRTNTCILIGRLGPSLGYNTKRKVLVPAFSRALKDTFVHARVAGLMAFMATIECFEIEDIATKVLPNMAFTMIDKEKLVRDQAFKAVDLFVKKLEVHAAQMLETATSDTNDVQVLPGALPGNTGTLVNSAAGAAGALAGWAISSIGKKLATSDLQSSIASTSNRPTFAPLLEDMSSGVDKLRADSQVMVAKSSPTLGMPMKGKGMRLGGHQTMPGLTSSLADELAAEMAETDAAESNPWGNDDLIDVNADQDDWSAFETASVTQVKPSDDNWDNNVTQLPAHTSPIPSKSPLLKAPMPRLPSTLSKTRPLSRSTTPSSSPPQLQASASDWNDTAEWDNNSVVISQVGTSTKPLLSGMSREDKANEIARRKEERKQRIAMLKEQKKNIATP